MTGADPAVDILRRLLLLASAPADRLHNMALIRSWALVGQVWNEHIVLRMHVSVIVYAIAARSRISDLHVLLYILVERCDWALLSCFLACISGSAGAGSGFSMCVAFHLLRDVPTRHRGLVIDDVAHRVLLVEALSA